MEMILLEQELSVDSIGSIRVTAIAHEKAICHAEDPHEFLSRAALNARPYAFHFPHDRNEHHTLTMQTSRNEKKLARCKDLSRHYLHT
ncbi:hypothetical protein DPMN_194541 [Dreissena polymorpha]|uniref:Uncharacterized protein n=1 Tax=Dreissena polymorpha TaxID=45954 RepID=A0A9D3Y309_DREPO|nr:hypothetical protein DPMN_194541 [Dreissena polymorpha]